MKIDVFVSYHTETASDVADAVVAKLEQQGLRCWYAPRDVAGDFADSIVEAIEQSSIFVVLLNESACKSKHVGREVSYACEIDELEVIPFRITDVQLYGKLKYYLKPLHWVDGVGSKRTSGLDELSERIMKKLNRPAPVSTKSTSTPRIETIKYDDGSVYTGEVLNGKRHGKGKLVWPSGDVYEGDWKDDKRNGKGTLIWGKDSQWVGDIYEGDYVNGLRHGTGSYYYSSGSVYEGEWKNGEQSGKGTFTWPDGSRYEGDYLGGKYHGTGKFTWGKDTKWAGDVYDGDWVNGKRTGYGTYTYANGKVESGRFENNKYLGK